MTREIAVVVVSYNKKQYTELCLKGLLASDPQPEQLVVVDNGSEDGSVQMLDGPVRRRCAEEEVDFAFIANDENLGACTARNQALEVTEGRYVAFIDNDAAVRSRDWLAVLASVLDESDEVGIVGPKLLFPFEPYNIECAGVGISSEGRVKYLGRGSPKDAPEFCSRTPVQCLTSACWLMRRKLYKTLGGLDEAFNPAQFEDFDFCYRAREAGWTVLYEPDAEMYHYENTTTAGSNDLNFKYVTIKNWQVFKERWRHMFEKEDGPPTDDCMWKPLETKPLHATGEPPIIEPNIPAG
ncbi:MAG: glycosyltransferase family 2 protein [Armatimonadota bacterium]